MSKNELQESTCGPDRRTNFVIARPRLISSHKTGIRIWQMVIIAGDQVPCDCTALEHNNLLYIFIQKNVIILGIKLIVEYDIIKIITNKIIKRNRLIFVMYLQHTQVINILNICRN